MLRGHSVLVDLARPIYRRVRTSYLRWRYPRGAVITSTGVPVFCDFRDASYVWYDADSPYLRFHKSVLRALVRQSSGGVFVDVGAHFGFYTALLSKMLTAERRQSTILAIEPDQHHVVCLRETAARCKTRFVNVEVLDVALGERDGTVPLFRSAASCLHSYAETDAVPCYEVPLFTLDSLLRSRSEAGERVALIKLDVDGAEPYVMDGWTSTIRQHRPLVLTEFSPVALVGAGRDPRAIFYDLCSRFHVTHIDHVEEQVVPVTSQDFDAIATKVGDGVTDLVLSHNSLAEMGQCHRDQ